MNTGGVYLFPDPVPHNATIVSFRGFGVTGDRFNESLDSDPLIPAARETDVAVDLVAPFLYVLLYRPTANTFYTLVEDLTQLAHGFAPGRVPADRGKTLDWDARKGDFIGAYIPYSCVNRTSDGLLQCPSQINLVVNNCRSALYHPALSGVNNVLMSEFQEVSVSLNMEAIMVPCKLSTWALDAKIAYAVQYVGCYGET